MKKLISTLIIIISATTFALSATNSVIADNEATNKVSKASANDTTSENNDNSDIESTKLLKGSSLYVLPLLNSTKIDELKKDDKITVVSVNGDWAYIYSEKNAGWVFADNVESIKNSKKESENAEGNLENSTNSTNTTSNENVTNVQNFTDTSNNVNSTNEINSDDDSDKNTANSNDSNKSNTSSKTNVKYPMTMYVNVSAAYIRSSASASSDKVTSVGLNCPVTVLSKEGDWYKVEVSEGKGYMKSSLLSLDKQ